MKVYISGQITGLDIKTAKMLFLTAENYLKSIGHTTINPFDLNGDSDDWQKCMLVDIAELFTCDAIAMLNNWGFSKGARIEHHIATVLGKDILYLNGNCKSMWL